jgi:TRAP-type C4-dicarboxylate transport system substrate-binding protein
MGPFGQLSRRQTNSEPHMPLLRSCGVQPTNLEQSQLFMALCKRPVPAAAYGCRRAR